jgi:hypothetical protein
MHTKKQDTNIIIFSNNDFFDSFNELEKYCDFKIYSNIKGTLTDKSILLIHEEYLSDKKNIEQISKLKNIKVIFHNKNFNLSNINHNLKILLPLSFIEINNMIQNLKIKSDFNINSSIKIKNYLLDKNTKKLIYNDLFIILTEKEIHILEILLKRNEPISKNSLLELVWNYSKNTDTHTVETHIYRLRKKVKDKFDDDNLILNTKTGYSL